MTSTVHHLTCRHTGTVLAKSDNLTELHQLATAFAKFAEALPDDPDLLKDIANRCRTKITKTAGHDLLAALCLEALHPRTDIDLPVHVTKSDHEQRYTFGPLYIPDTVDAHDHFADAETLQKAVWDWMTNGERDIRLQHSPIVAGTMVELACWPYPHTVDLAKADGTSNAVDLPENTPWIGVKWKPWAWDLVKSGDISGMSLAGKALLTPSDAVT